MSYRILSLFSGAGGLDIGFAQAGFSPIWSNEIVPNAVKTYETQMSAMGVTPHATCGDILLQDLPSKSEVDIIIGGPPCQGFSVAGKMNPNDPRSKHVYNFLSVVEKMNPVAFVMENVKSLAINTRFKGVREELIQRGESLGYNVKLLLLNSADYGVPQARERMFLIGTKTKCVETPKKSTRRRSVRKAFQSLAPYGDKGNDNLCRAIITPAINPVLRNSPYAGMLFNGQGRPINLDCVAPTLPASMGGNRTPIIDQRTLDENAENWVVSYHDKLLKGSKPRKKIPKRLRRLTLQEASCIQGFPKGMVFHGSQSSAFSQIGNAVPPPMAKAVAKSLLVSLGS